MMKRLAFVFALVLSAAAVTLALLQVPVLPPFLAAGAWFMGLTGTKSMTRNIDAFAWMISMMALFYSLDPLHYGLPWFAVACVGMMAVFMFRSIFLHSIGLTRFIWVDAVAALVLVGGYVMGNLTTSAGWVGWAAPALPVFYSVFKTIGAMLDFKAIGPLKKKKYKVEVGAPAPEFTLRDQEGKMVSLSDYKGKNSVLLVFVRGDWCPSCHITLRTYERNKDKLEKGNVVVIGIGPDPIGVNSDMVKRLGVSYHMLADEKLECVSRYGIQAQDNNPMTRYDPGIPLPATFLVCPDGYIRYTSRADNPGEILNPNDIFPILEKIAS
jgi:peroxiredoxin